jgi:hypothetical protein
MCSGNQVGLPSVQLQAVLVGGPGVYLAGASLFSWTLFRSIGRRGPIRSVSFAFALS